MPLNPHPDSTFSSTLHNDWTFLQTGKTEYPQPDIRGPMPINSHPDSTFSSHLHNDWTHVQMDHQEYPQPDIRGPMPINSHPDSTFSSHLHNDWTHVMTDEYPQPDIRGPMPLNPHPDSTFSSTLHNDWTFLQTDAEEPDFYTGVHAFGAKWNGADLELEHAREMPHRFSNEEDDRLMNSLIGRYSLEFRAPDGSRTGSFFCNKEGALAVAKEAMATAYHWDAKKTASFLADDDLFDNTWTHFNVNKDDVLETTIMPQFLRKLIGATEISLQ